MIYRDDGLAARVRVEQLRAQVARLRARPPEAEDEELRARLRRHRRRIARARRAVARLRSPVLRLLPQSLVEVVVSLGLAYAILIALGVGALVIRTLVVPLLG